MSTELASLEEQARALIEKQEEFKGKILTERASHLARVSELDGLLAQLGGIKKRAVRPKPGGGEDENGGEAPTPLDDEDEAQERPIPDPTLSKREQILQIIRKLGPQTRQQITDRFPHANSAEKARTWTPMSQLVRSGKLVENKLGQLEIPKR